MSISRDDGEVSIECDDCAETYSASQIDMEGASFEEFWAVLKEDGWQASSGSGGWTRRCPDCT